MNSPSALKSFSGALKPVEFYRLQFKPSLEKDFRRLPTAALARLTEAIQTLATTPLPRGSRKISGADRLYRLRVGEYRVIYEVDSVERIIFVHYVRHRRDAYRSL